MKVKSDLEIKINQILSDDSNLNVSEIIDELCEQGIEVNQRTLMKYLKKKLSQTLNKRMMNFTTDHLDARLKWCQSNKNKSMDLVNFVMKLYLVTLDKVKK